MSHNHLSTKYPLQVAAEAETPSISAKIPRVTFRLSSSTILYVPGEVREQSAEVLFEQVSSFFWFVLLFVLYQATEVLNLEYSKTMCYIYFYVVSFQISVKLGFTQRGYH